MTPLFIKTSYLLKRVIYFNDYFYYILWIFRWIHNKSEKKGIYLEDILPKKTNTNSLNESLIQDKLLEDYVYIMF